MDKKRFLIDTRLFRFSSPLILLIILGAIWWFFFYLPLLSKISFHKNALKEASYSQAYENQLKHEISRAQAEKRYLKNKQSDVTDNRGFSEQNLSREILDLAQLCNTKVLFFRAKPWREKGDRTRCEIEIGIVGSDAVCSTFLHNILSLGGKIISFTCEPVEDQQVKISGVFDLYKATSIKREKLLIKEVGFKDSNSLFKEHSTEALPQQDSYKKGARNSVAKKNKTHQNAPWLSLNNLPKAHHQEPAKDFRILKASKNTVVV